MSDLLTSAQELLATINKWNLGDGTLEPRSSAARKAWHETIHGVLGLHHAIDTNKGEAAWSSVSRDDADAARSVLWGVVLDLSAAGFVSGAVDCGGAHPVKLDASIVKRLQHGISLLHTPLAESTTVPTAEVLTPKPAEPTAKRKKPGSKGTAERDAKIADEYRNGLENCYWANRADYLRKKHAPRVKKTGQKASNAWLSQLLTRVDKRERLNESDDV